MSKHITIILFYIIKKKEFIQTYIIIPVVLPIK